jgi:hypothetical protein
LNISLGFCPPAEIDRILFESGGFRNIICHTSMTTNKLKEIIQNDADRNAWFRLLSNSFLLAGVAAFFVLVASNKWYFYLLFILCIWLSFRNFKKRKKPGLEISPYEDPRAPILFLRPFFTDRYDLNSLDRLGNEARKQLVVHPKSKYERKMDTPGIHVFRMLDVKLYRQGRTLLLGKKDQFVYGDIILVSSEDKHWEQVFKFVAKNCAVIVVVPFGSKGSLAELKFLIDEDLLSKVLVYIPKARSVVETTLRFEEGWKFAKATLAKELQLNLPEYESMLYRPNKDFSPREKWAYLDQMSINEAFDQLLQEQQNSAMPLAEMLPVLEEKGCVVHLPRVLEGTSYKINKSTESV